MDWLDAPASPGKFWLRLLAAGGLLAMAVLLLAHLWGDQPYGLDLVVQWTGLQVIFWLLVAAGLATWQHRRLTAVVPAAVAVAVMGLSLPAYWPDAGPRPAGESVAFGMVIYNAGVTNPAEDAELVRWIGERRPELVLISEAPYGMDWQVFREMGYEVQQRYRAVCLSLTPVEPITPPDQRRIRYYRVDLGGEAPLHLAQVHLLSPRTPELWEQQLRQVDRLTKFAREAAELGRPTVVAGDFNSTPLGRGYARFERRSGLRNVGHAPWRGGTWPSWMPTMLSIPIDHVWASGEIAAAHHEVGPACESDHRPVYVAMAVPGEMIRPE